MRLNSIGNFIYEIIGYWLKDRVSTLSAAFAYFSLFSLAPTLFICITLLGIIYGSPSAEQQIMNQIGSIIGPNSAHQLSQMINSEITKPTSLLELTIGGIILIIGAIGFFTQLLGGLNVICEVQSKPGIRIRDIIMPRILAFIFILIIGLFLLLSLVLSTAMGLLHTIFNHPNLIEYLHFIVSLIIITLFFFLIYKFIPDAKIKSRYIWLASFLASLLFTIGKSLLGWYLSHATFTSKFGIAGSLVIILLWLYYTGQIIFTSAEVIKVSIKRTGKNIEPSKNAVSTCEATA